MGDAGHSLPSGALSLNVGDVLREEVMQQHPLPMNLTTSRRADTFVLPAHCAAARHSTDVSTYQGVLVAMYSWHGRPGAIRIGGELYRRKHRSTASYRETGNISLS